MSTVQIIQSQPTRTNRLSLYFDINNKKLNPPKNKDNKDNVVILVKKNVQNKILFKLPFVPPLSPLPLYHCPEAFSSLR